MKKYLSIALLTTSLFGSNSLGSVAGITFGDDISRIEKIKDIKCSSFKETKLKYCSLNNQKIIDDNRLDEIYFYFNKDDKLYQLKFYTEKVKLYKRAFQSQIDEAQTKIDSLTEFLDNLPVDNKNIVSKTPAKFKMIAESITDKFFSVYAFYYNKKMDSEVVAYEKSLKEKASKKIKANY